MNLTIEDIHEGRTVHIGYASTEQALAVLERLGYPEPSSRTYVTDIELLEAVPSGLLKPKPDEPDWREIEREDLRPGDIVRVELEFSRPGTYEPERRVLSPAQLRNGYIHCELADGSGVGNPDISSADIYSSIQVDMKRRGPEWEEIQFEDIEKGDYIRSTYKSGVREGVAHKLDDSYGTFSPDWSAEGGRIISGGLSDNEQPVKIERKVQA